MTFDCTQKYLWDRNWRLLEVRSGPGETLKQTLWGARGNEEGKDLRRLGLSP